jgi:hypothetical protein
MIKTIPRISHVKRTKVSVYKISRTAKIAEISHPINTPHNNPPTYAGEIRL